MASKTMFHAPNGLGQQGSIYSLTLEEFQNSLLQSGKIGSMNMDEFVRNVEDQAMGTTNDESGQSIQRQGSMNIPLTLSHKTVEEVWKEIQEQKQQQHQHEGQEQEQEQQHEEQEQEQSMGEMTLEAFLVKAGVVKEDGDGVTGIDADAATGDVNQQQQQADWYTYQMKQQQQQQHMLQQQAEAMSVFAKRSPVSNLILPTGPPCNYFDGCYEGAALTPVMGGPDTPGKKRSVDVVVEKTVERRQRRMIKNRESAARSRARKQAYTVELEAEVSQLKEENMRLTRWQAEEAERRRKQIMEALLPATRQQENQTETTLRRTRSFP